MRVRHSNRAAVSPVILVAVLLTVVVLAVAFVLYPYATRYDGYANDPGEPPAGCTGDPAWQARFQIPVAIDLKKTDGDDYQIEKFQVPVSTVGGPKMLDAEGYDGQPWKAWTAALEWSHKPSRIKVVYTLAVWDEDGRTIENTDHAYLSETTDYTGYIKTDWWFFWDEQVGEVFQWTLSIHPVDAGGKEGVSKTRSGSFVIKDDGKVVN